MHRYRNCWLRYVLLLFTLFYTNTNLQANDQHLASSIGTRLKPKYQHLRKCFVELNWKQNIYLFRTFNWSFNYVATFTLLMILYLIQCSQTLLYHFIITVCRALSGSWLWDFVGSHSAVLRDCYAVKNFQCFIKHFYFLSGTFSHSKFSRMHIFELWLLTHGLLSEKNTSRTRGSSTNSIGGAENVEMGNLRNWSENLI